MSTYDVRFVKSAKKEFDRLPKKVKEKIIEAIQFLSNNPFSELLKVKKIKGGDSLYRFRVGDYRVVYHVKNKLLLIIVIKIGHRREVYRRF